MTKTREQKEQAIEYMKEMMEDKKGFIVFGFSGISVNRINDFRGQILDSGGEMRVVKRRLLALAFDQKKIDFELEKFIGQTSFVTFSSSLPDIASTIFNFVGDDEIKIFGGYDLEEKAFIEADYIERVGNLPSRDVLLSQVIGAISAPLTSFMQAVKQISESK